MSPLFCRFLAVMFPKAVYLYEVQINRIGKDINDILSEVQKNVRKKGFPSQIFIDLVVPLCQQHQEPQNPRGPNIMFQNSEDTRHPKHPW